MANYLPLITTCILAFAVIKPRICLDNQDEYCPDACMCDINGLVKCTEFDRNITWPKLWMELSKVPHEIKSLYITGSVSEVLEPASFKFNDLKELHIQDASISSIKPFAFFHLPKLQKLHFNNNNISMINGSHFAFLPSLLTLNLSNNDISSVHPNTFLNLSSLIELDLSHNQLMSIPSMALSFLVDVKIIDLSHNQLQYIHPNTFSSLSQLETVHLEYNQLETLHHATFMNTSLSIAWLAGNPWGCHCGITWLVNAITDENSEILYMDKNALHCSSPVDMVNKAVMELEASTLACESPEFVHTPNNESVQYLHSFMLHCNVSTSMVSLYWLTPHGVLVHSDHRRWLPPEITHFSNRLSFAGGPSYYKASVEALANGSLAFSNFRLYFVGEYTCVAENPEGVATSQATVQIYSIIHTVMEFSTLIGYTIAIACLIFGIISGAIRYCAERTCDKDKTKAGSTADHQNEQMPTDEEFWDDIMYQFEYDNKLRSPSLSPRMSPRKCVTPAEYEYDGDAPPHLTDDIKELLIMVRLRLRLGLETSTERVRTVTASLRDHSAHQVEYMRERAHTIRQNMRESTSQSLQRMRATSSQYASSVRTGMAMGLEQVKNHVQSMKELCGTSDVAGTQTVSVVSIQTDVDSQETTEVVKAITHV